MLRYVLNFAIFINFSVLSEDRNLSAKAIASEQLHPQHRRRITAIPDRGYRHHILRPTKKVRKFAHLHYKVGWILEIRRLGDRTLRALNVASHVAEHIHTGINASACPSFAAGFNFWSLGLRGRSRSRGRGSSSLLSPARHFHRRNLIGQLIFKFRIQLALGKRLFHALCSAHVVDVPVGFSSIGFQEISTRFFIGWLGRSRLFCLRFWRCGCLVLRF